MEEASRRGLREGMGFGVIAGVIFAGMEILAAVLMGNPPLMPIRMFASVVLGQEAMTSTPIAAVLVVGSIAHLVLSGAFGVLYGLINARLSVRSQTHWGRQVGMGLLFGAALWFVNFQVIARILYPWFLTAPQVLQMLMHAVFFGLPLGVMMAGAERRVHHVRRAEVTA